MGWGDVASGKASSSGGAGKGGWGSVANAGVAVEHQQVHPGGGGGMFGWLGSAGHWVGQKAGLAGHDIAAMGGGTLHLADSLIYQPWKNAITTGHPYAHGAGKNIDKTVNQTLNSTVGGTAETFSHPLRDPFQTLLTAGAVASLGAGGIARVGAAGRAAAGAEDAGLLGKTAAAGKALTRKPLMPTRELRVPTLVKDANGDLQTAHQPLHLVESHAPLARAFQALHDRIVQRSLDNNLTGEKPSLLGKYGLSRVDKATQEEGRLAVNARSAPVKMLGSAKHFDKGIPAKTGQLALFLRSANVLGHEARDFWKAQADAGVNPQLTGKLAQAADRIHQQGMLHLDTGGRVAVNAEKFPRLAAVDTLARENQAVREGVLSDNKLMSKEGMTTRKALVANTLRSEAARNPESGLREGQGYTDLSISKKRGPASSFARSRGPKVPQVKKLGVGPEATGEGVRSGLIPDNTTRGIADSTAQALRYVASKEQRSAVYRFGSDIKRHGKDFLIADPHALKLGQIPLDTKQLLGMEHSTLNTLPPEEEAGLAGAMKAKLEDAIPHLISPKAKALEDGAGIGTEAPAGFRWVPREAAASLFHETGPRTGFTKAVNSLNSAVTAATVYFKLSHIPQRLATDATTSVLNGALTPANIRAAILLRKELTAQEFGELTAATGTHGYQALPQEGDTVAARAARSGAGFYAHRVDAPFRFLNLVHEARKAGIRDAQGMRDLIQAAKDPAKASPRQLSVLKRSNRVSMIYDGLGPREQRIIARGLWFYPWTKASVRFAGHTIAEHPLASGVGGRLAAIGEADQAKRLGPLPYYEFGLSPVGANSVVDVSRLSPFSTAGDWLQTPAHLETVRGNLNPAAAAFVDLLTGTNSYGQAENRGKAALGDVTAPTPEAQMLSGFLGRHGDTSKKMFPNPGGWWGVEAPLLRAIFGPSYPRRVNKGALAKAAARK